MGLGAEINTHMYNINLRAEVHRLVPKLFRAEVTRAEHRLPHREQGFYDNLLILANNFLSFISGAQVNSATMRKNKYRFIVFITRMITSAN